MADAIDAKGWVFHGVKGADRDGAVRELQALLPLCAVRYVWGDADFFVDAKVWSETRSYWDGFYAALEDNPQLSPKDFGIPRGRPDQEPIHSIDDD